MVEVDKEERRESILDLKRYSSWIGAVQVMAWILRFGQRTMSN